MKKLIALLCMALIAAVQSWASMPTIAQITVGETTKDYMDEQGLIDAFGDINDEAIVTLLDDVTLPDGLALDNSSEDAVITLNLNGHNITGNCSDAGIIFSANSKIQIEGEGIVENIGKNGSIFDCGGGIIEVKGGTYKCESDICWIVAPGIITIKNGKFNASSMYYSQGMTLKSIAPVAKSEVLLPMRNSFNAPNVEGGVFSIDPAECVAFGYEVALNDDAKAKDEYPYKVVKSDVVPTNAAGLLSVPQAGELNIRAYFTAKIGEFYEYCLVRGECHNINDVYAVVEANPDDVICKGKNMSSVITVPQAFSVKDDEKYLEAGEKYTLFVFGLPNSAGSTFKSNNLDGPINQKVIPTELAVIPFIVGVGEINTQTAIEHINADKAQKAIKTIENGKVVIIRGDKKYDLSGREM